MPVDAEQVARVNIPEADTLQFILYFRGNLRRVFHLCIGGDDDVALFGAFDGVFAAGLINS